MYISFCSFSPTAGYGKTRALCDLHMKQTRDDEVNTMITKKSAKCCLLDSNIQQMTTHSVIWITVVVLENCSNWIGRLIFCAGWIRRVELVKEEYRHSNVPLASHHRHLMKNIVILLGSEHI